MMFCSLIKAVLEISNLIFLHLDLLIDLAAKCCVLDVFPLNIGVGKLLRVSKVVLFVLWAAQNIIGAFALITTHFFTLFQQFALHNNGIFLYLRQVLKHLSGAQQPFYILLYTFFHFFHQPFLFTLIFSLDLCLNLGIKLLHGYLEGVFRTKFWFIEYVRLHYSVRHVVLHLILNQLLLEFEWFLQLHSIFKF